MHVPTGIGSAMKADQRTISDLRGGTCEETSAQFRCRSCDVVLPNHVSYKEHYRTSWHLYNMKRCTHNQAPVALSEFLRKIEVMRFMKAREDGDVHNTPLSILRRVQGVDCAANPTDCRAVGKSPLRGQDHLKRRRGSYAAGLKWHRTAEYISNAKARMDDWRKATMTRGQYVCFFDTHIPFPSEVENLSYMKRKYGFFIPDEEYLVDRTSFLCTVWKKLLKQPSCLLCSKRFASVGAAQHHMRGVGHTQLDWKQQQLGEKPNRLQRSLEDYYDYTRSYAELLERFTIQLHRKCSQRMLPNESQAGWRKEGVTLGCDTVEVSGDGRDDESECSEQQYLDSTAESDWVDVSSDEDSNRTSRNTQDIQKRLMDELTAKGWRPATLTASGDLRLPDGREAQNRNRSLRHRWRFSSDCGDAVRCYFEKKHFVRRVNNAVRCREAMDARSVRLIWRQKVVQHGFHNRLYERRMHALPRCSATEMKKLSKADARYYSRRQNLDLKVGVRANDLQRKVLRETKFFL